MLPWFFFLGGDTAPSETHRSDDGALCASAARPLREPDPKEGYSENLDDWFFAPIYARVFNYEHRLSASQWSGMIYALDERFGFDQLCLDAGAGGAGMMVAREMMNKKQIINNVEKMVTVIGDKVNGPNLTTHGRFILNMFKRGDPGIESVWPAPEGTGKSLAGDDLLKSALYGEIKTALDKRPMAMIAPAEEYFRQDGPHHMQTRTWPQERQWAIKNLDALTSQLKNIVAGKTNDGKEMFTSRGARVFNSLGKDDIAWSFMMSYTAFLIWLKGFDGKSLLDEDDKLGFSGG